MKSVLISREFRSLGDETAMTNEELPSASVTRLDQVRRERQEIERRRLEFEGYAYDPSLIERLRNLNTTTKFTIVTLIIIAILIPIVISAL